MLIAGHHLSPQKMSKPPRWLPLVGCIHSGSLIGASDVRIDDKFQYRCGCSARIGSRLCLEFSMNPWLKSRSSLLPYLLLLFCD